MKASTEMIEDFLSRRRIAMVGVSRDPASFNTKLFDDFCRRGYDMVPVNPNATVIGNRPCFRRLQDIQPPVEAALLMTAPDVTETAVRDCAEAGIKRVWMYRAAGQGAVSARAVDFCREHAIQVVEGECPYMFLPHSGLPHRLHGFLRKLTGSYPRHAQHAS
jgi:hypothetical protein